MSAKVNIYLDITGDIVKSKLLFQPNMLTGDTKTSSSRLSHRYTSAFYFTKKKRRNSNKTQCGQGGIRAAANASKGNGRTKCT